MFFRNITFFRFPAGSSAPFNPPPMGDGVDALENALQDTSLQPVGPLQFESLGWVPPFGVDDQWLAVRNGSASWIALGQEKKLLTPVAIAKAAFDRMRAAEERLGLKLNPKQRKAYKEEAVADMLPKAFVEPRRTDAYVDAAHRFIAIDTSSRKIAEGVVSHVRQALGSFPALPLSAEVAPRAVLTGWLAGDELPAGFTLGDECELKDPADKGAVVRMTHKDLGADEVQQFLAAGMQCTRLALVWQDRISFSFGEDLVLRKVRLFEGALETIADGEFDTQKQELQARFALFVGEIGRLFTDLATVFKLSTPEPVEETAAPASEPSAEQAAPWPADEPDPLYPEAERIVVSTQRTSISHLQRQMKIGYNRAARLIEAMEAAGVLSAPSFNGDRQLLAKPAKPAKKTKSPKGLEGIDSIEVSIAGAPPVKLTPEQFANAGTYVSRMVEIIEWVRDNERVQVNTVTRYLKCGVADATLLLESLESTGVVMRDGDYWIALSPGASP